jgi:hypothetical protein
MDDADVPIWSEVQPRLTEAIGQLIDLAVLWGIGKPTTWGESVFTGAGKSQHFIVQGTGVDLGQDVTKLGALLALSGYTVNGFAAMPGTKWNLAGLRSAQGVPIYQPDMQAGPGGALYGYPMPEVNNGSWQTGLTGAVMLCGDFTKSIIGIRSDISFKVFDQGVISNDSGVVIFNLMQQDAVALRVTMRLAYATANPVTIMEPTKPITGTPPPNNRWPFGAILPVGATPPVAAAISVIQAPPYPYTGTYMSDEQEAQATEEREAVAAERREMLERGPVPDEVEEEEAPQPRRSGRSRERE